MRSAAEGCPTAGTSLVRRSAIHRPMNVPVQGAPPPAAATLRGGNGGGIGEGESPSSPSTQAGAMGAGPTAATCCRVAGTGRHLRPTCAACEASLRILVTCCPSSWVTMVVWWLAALVIRPSSIAACRTARVAVRKQSAQWGEIAPRPAAILASASTRRFARQSTVDRRAPFDSLRSPTAAKGRCAGIQTSNCAASSAEISPSKA